MPYIRITVYCLGLRDGYLAKGKGLVILVLYLLLLLLVLHASEVWHGGEEKKRQNSTFPEGIKRFCSKQA